MSAASPATTTPIRATSWRRQATRWSTRSADGEVDLEFEPGAEHTETRNLGLVRSRFAQPLGTFRGTLRVGDRTLELDRCLGVVEDQDVVW